MSKTLPALIFSALLLAGCDNTDPPTDAPANLQVTAGEGFLALTWDVVADRTYWAIYNAGSSVSLDDNDGIQFNAEPPFFIDDLSNSTEYAIALTSSVGSSSVGPFTATALATPRQWNESIPWSISTSLTSENLNDVTFFEDHYVVVGDNGSLFLGNIDYTATDPVHGVIGVSEWNPPTSIPDLTGVDLISVITDGENFIAMGRDGSIITSDEDDPTVWTQATAIGSVTDMNDIGISNTLFFAVGDGGAIYTNISNAVSGAWDQRGTGLTSDFNGIGFFGSTYVIVGDGGVLLTSTDTVTWTPVTTGTTEDLYDITISLDEGIYVIVGDNGTILTSENLTDWTLQTASAPVSNLRDISYGIGNQFVIISENGEVIYSDSGDDGSWVVDVDIDNMGTVVGNLNALISNRSYIAVGANGTIISGR